MLRKKQPVANASAFGLCLLIPLLMGGCPQFRDDMVSAFESAARGILLDGANPEDEFSATGDLIAVAAFDLFFDQFRSE